MGLPRLRVCFLLKTTSVFVESNTLKIGVFPYTTWYYKLRSVVNNFVIDVHLCFLFLGLFYDQLWKVAAILHLSSKLR